MSTGASDCAACGHVLGADLQPVRTFLPTKEQARTFAVVIGSATILLAFAQLIWPRTAAPSGRWSWLTAPLFNAFGSLGLSLLYLAIGVFLLTIGVRKGR